MPERIQKEFAEWGIKIRGKDLKDLTDEELRELISILIDGMPYLISFWMAKPIVLGSENKKKITDMMMPKYRKILDAFEQFQSVQSGNLSFIGILDCMLKSILSPEIEIPEDKTFIESYIELLKGVLEEPKDLEYIKQTSFTEYSNAMKRLVDDISQHGRLDKIDELYRDPAMLEDLQVLMQSTNDKLIPLTKELNKPVKKLTKKKVERFISIYGEMAGLYEKQIRIVVALIEIKDGVDKPDYNRISSNSLRNNVDKVKKRTEYSMLGEFNVTIRNSIAHEATILDVLGRKVSFRDRKDTVELSYGDVLCVTRELSALVLVLFNIKTYPLYLRYLFLKERLV